MDRATLPHAKSPIPHCTQALLQAIFTIFKAHCYTLHTQGPNSTSSICS